MLLLVLVVEVAVGLVLRLHGCVWQETPTSHNDSLVVVVAVGVDIRNVAGAFVGLRWSALAFVLSRGSVMVSGTVLRRLLLLRACVGFGGLSGACVGLEWPNRVSTMVLGRNGWWRNVCRGVEKNVAGTALWSSLTTSVVIVVNEGEW